MRSSLVLALAALMVVAAVVGSAALRDENEPVVDLTAPAPVQPPVVMVRSGRAVTPEWVSRAADLPGVENVMFVRRGQALLRRLGRSRRRSRAAGAPRATRYRSTRWWHRPRAYGPMLPRPARAAVEGLKPGEAVLSQTAALVRGVDVGGRLSLADDAAVAGRRRSSTTVR